MKYILFYSKQKRFINHSGGCSRLYWLYLQKILIHSRVREIYSEPLFLLLSSPLEVSRIHQPRNEANGIRLLLEKRKKKNVEKYIGYWFTPIDCAVRKFRFKFVFFLSASSSSGCAVHPLPTPPMYEYNRYMFFYPRIAYTTQDIG